MSLLTRLFGARKDDRDVARPLWYRVVEIAREKEWYRDCGVADTVAGRFDAVTLVLSIVLLRMEREPELIEPSVRLTELFVEDMDGQLRESGVGDVIVGKHVGKLMGTLGGRLGAYRDALDAGEQALAEAVGRNVTLVEGADPLVVARRARAFAAGLALVPAFRVLDGEIGR
ncbi:ubiquinol-cytochrome C chaperone family protein [Novosphingobium cyanobacteriorum]|uniref:Ubiquinol-cytochrome C chaperone family protein n=1 Tax=Novosphingobium cyanobacteriorum TaxID=3024215 RepID=A0ABT6CFN2_9SPHN|nr:ubiquinol-cytochrome C chaperone family protein [Novosphingobium cyanobacteriorum]MDF8332726.1 ubiquinol-cytochrome C chaperone family protein [Novosphingobium cyanobacteriorum]